MSDIGTKVIQNIFNHLTHSYSENEAREILKQRYPDKADTINMTVASKPSMDVNVQVASKPVKVAKVKADKPVKTKKVSNMGRARTLYAEAADKSRGAITELFMKELGMEKTVAGTYFYVIKREHS